MATPKRAATTMVAALLAGLVAGCTPSGATTVTPTPGTSGPPPSTSTTPGSPPASSQPGSPTPNSTLSANQRAATDAVHGLVDTSMKLGSRPSQYTDPEMVKELQRYGTGDVPDAIANSYSRLRKNGWRYEGGIAIETVKVAKPSLNGTRVIVTACQNQSDLRIVNMAGEIVTDEQKNITAFLLRQYTVHKTNDAAWKVSGFETVKGECGA